MTTEEVLYRTNGGYDVFAYYLGDSIKKKSFQNPYRNDHRASCSLYNHGERYWLQDFGSSDWSGDCFNFVACVHNLDLQKDFVEIINIICNDLCFADMKPSLQPCSLRMILPSPIDSVVQKPTISSFDITYQQFTNNEKKYWETYGIDIGSLGKYGVKSVACSLFKRNDGTDFTLRGTEEQPMYAYTFKGFEGIKFYRPFSQLRFLNAGILPKPYIFGWQQLPANGAYVIITGGEKDVLTLASKGIPAITLNSETAKVDVSLIESLSKRFNKIFFCYDSDATGLAESEKNYQLYSEDYTVKKITLPLKGTKEEKDISDYFAKGYKLSDFERLIKNA